MCNIWKTPTTVEEEFRPELLEKLPDLSFCNITGGEPFLRADLEDIVKIVLKKTDRLVISTNGYLVSEIITLAKKHPDIGIRISLEGLSAINDELRGIPEGFDRGMRTLLELQSMGLQDIGFALTVSDRNHNDMIELYHLAKRLKVEFATAAVHNSYYFHKNDNRIHDTAAVSRSLKLLVQELLQTWKIKNLYRAYFNQGLINYIKGNPRWLPCRAGTDLFFLDPWGEIRPCNGMEEQIWLNSMGNLHTSSFSEIWNSQLAKEVRDKVKTCPKNCWMIGTAGPAMKRNLLLPSVWVVANKLRTIFSRNRASKSHNSSYNK